VVQGGVVGVRVDRLATIPTPAVANSGREGKLVIRPVAQVSDGEVDGPVWVRLQGSRVGGRGKAGHLNSRRGAP
jgi:hypothetical protein